MTPNFQNYREDVDRMIGAALAAVDPYQAVRRAMRREGRMLYVRSQRFDVARRRVYIVATGKAAVPMAQAAARIVDDALTAGVVIAKNTADTPPDPTPDSEFPQLTVYYAAHPVPDDSSVTATTAVLDMLADTTANDVVLCLISGGSSALLTQPRLPLTRLQPLTQELLRSGCTINELNIVRTQFDQIKGGGLALAAAPSACITLILSDVIGNPLEIIGSGPTISTTHTPADARAVLARYELLTPDLDVLLAELASTAQDTNTAVGQARQLRVPYIIGDVREAALGALQEAQWMGFTAQLLTYHLEGEAREVGRFAASLAKSILPGHAYMLGGETTVTIATDSPGVGGRNLEVALSAAQALDGLPHTLIATFATDGDDGPTGTAGAIVTGETAQLAANIGLNTAVALAQHDSGTFFQQLDAKMTDMPPHLTITGPTGTNVNDLIFILKYL